MSGTADNGGGLTVIGALIFIFLAYASGRWQMNRAGDLIDAQFKNHPRGVVGLTTLAGAIFSNEILPQHPITAVTAGAGLLMILEDGLNTVSTMIHQKQLKKNLDIHDQPVELSGGSPIPT